MEPEIKLPILQIYDRLYPVIVVLMACVSLVIAYPILKIGGDPTAPLILFSFFWLAIIGFAYTLMRPVKILLEEHQVTLTPMIIFGWYGNKKIVRPMSEFDCVEFVDFRIFTEGTQQLIPLPAEVCRRAYHVALRVKSKKEIPWYKFKRFNPATDDILFDAGLFKSDNKWFAETLAKLLNLSCKHIVYINGRRSEEK